MNIVSILRRAAITLALIPAPLAAQDIADVDMVQRWQEDRMAVFEAGEIDLAAFKWIARPVVIFGESPFDPQYQQQMQLLADGAEELALRDVIVIVDTDPEAQSDIRRLLRPRAFMLTLIGKDGGVKLRKPAPWDVREISRSIDKMPMRQQEIRDRRGIDG